jgi:cobalamin biosynthesis Mg chelatase CobN
MNMSSSSNADTSTIAGLQTELDRMNDTRMLLKKFNAAMSEGSMDGDVMSSATEDRMISSYSKKYADLMWKQMLSEMEQKTAARGNMQGRDAQTVININSRMSNTDLSALFADLGRVEARA